MRSITAFPILLTVLLLASPALADEWQLAGAPSIPAGRNDHTLAYDSVRQRVVLFGGVDSRSQILDDTWEWDGGRLRWLRKFPLTIPIARYEAAMAFDAAHGNTLLFGGRGQSPTFQLADTWSFNGEDWLQLAPATSPATAGEFRRMVYDPIRGQILMYGGTGANTWNWDGATWINHTPLVQPGFRTGFGLAFDPPRGRILLFGGANGQNQVLGDTWEWNGATSLWTQLQPTSSPSSRADVAMASLGTGVLLYGGNSRSTFSWDGVTWTDEAPVDRPSSRYMEVAYDAARNRPLAFGAASAETWDWDGSNWTVPIAYPFPPASTAHRPGLAYAEARRRVLWFGGFDPLGGASGDVWSWDGSAWTRTGAATVPGALDGAVAWDERRNRLVLFGGRTTNNTRLNRTWEWDGTDWTEREPPHRPFVRLMHALTFAGDARGVILSGGTTLGAIVLGDTWAFDGVDWEEIPSTNLPPRYGHAMAYDPLRQRVVLFGGLGATSAGLSDTWEFDGSAWTQKLTSTTPSPRYLHQMAYDDDCQCIVMTGGVNPATGLQRFDTWEWNGAVWQQRQLVAPPFTGTPAIAYDRLRRRLVMQTSEAPPFVSDSATWETPAPAPCGYATSVAAFAPGAGTTSSSANALGAPNGAFTALGTGGVLTLGITPVTDGPGWDLIVAEHGFASGQVDENFLVELSADGSEWTRAAICAGGRCGVDLAFSGLEQAAWIRLSDLAPTEAGTGAPTLGADIDGVEIRSCVPEVCDGLDDDGDLVVDEGCDVDDDGWCAAGAAVVGTPPVCPGGGGDCDDRDERIYPSAAQACDGLNNDCADPSWPSVPPTEADADSDGALICDSDCDEADGRVYPNAPQICDGVNDDCNDPSWPAVPLNEQDLDGDGYAPCAHDCDEANPARHPGVAESCNGIDDDCDGLVDEGVTHAYFMDRDHDSFGNTVERFDVCAQPPDTVSVDGDCDDTDPSIHPGATEVVCDGIDQNCDGADQTLARDNDHDGVCTPADNCPSVPNPDQADADGDARGDTCDNCPSIVNGSQQNSDGDITGDACDNCPFVSNYQDDFEGDGIGDACDNCPYDVNRSQSDFDHDQQGDLCDLDDGLILLFRTEPGYIEWHQEAGCSAFNVYEGDLAVLRASGVYTQPPGSNALAQRSCNVAATYVADFDTPAGGTVQFALVTGITGGVEGSLGTNSAGAVRPNSAPCP